MGLNKVVSHYPPNQLTPIHAHKWLEPFTFQKSFKFFRLKYIENQQSGKIFYFGNHEYNLDEFLLAINSIIRMIFL